MLRNFFIVAVRNFLQQGLYSLINVVGLTSGLICTLFIFLWVRDEVEKDRFHKDAAKLFSVVANLEQGDNGIVTWGTPGPLGNAIRERIPEVEFVAQTQDEGPQLLTYEDKLFLERGLYADPDFFKIFTFPITQGKPSFDARDKTWICLSASLARKIFGSADPIGKQLRLGKNHLVSVTGVFADTPTASSLKFDFVLPFELYREFRGNGFDWGNFDHPLYLKLKDPAKAEEIIKAINVRTASINTAKGVVFAIQPFAEHYLHADFENGKPAGGRILFVRIFSVVAVFILLIACINFMNMATARASTRAKEVGVRKVAGAQRSSLILQFLSESLVISFLSMLAAVIVVSATLPVFNTLVNKQIVFNIGQPGMIAAMIGLIAGTGVFAGSYPAFFLSSLRPASILKGKFAASGGGFSLRQVLVVFQFSLTVILVAGAIVIYNQIEFIRSKNIGYDRQSVLAFNANRAIIDNFGSFKTEAARLTGVKLVARADSKLVQVNNQNGSVDWSGKPSDNRALFRTVVVDYDFLETMGLNLVQGRLFSKKFNDTSNFVITERAAEVMGMDNPIGQKITQWGIPGTIVGVVSDFHSRSLHESVDPVIFMCDPRSGSTVVIRFEGAQTTSVVASLGKLFKIFSPGYPFEYSFLEEDFERLYDNEKVTGTLARLFTGMAILISALGLLGLAAYTTERKKKEIGIRKTLGASVSGLVTSISREFIQLSVIAIVVGCPIAWYLMTKFLQGYAYHIDLDWKIFGTTAVAVLTVSLMTVIYQVSKAAIANPVDALRNE